MSLPLAAGSRGCRPRGKVEQAHVAGRRQPQDQQAQKRPSGGRNPERSQDVYGVCPGDGPCAYDTRLVPAYVEHTGFAANRPKSHRVRGELVRVWLIGSETSPEHVGTRTGYGLGAQYG
ncbi:hypothetical protein AK812_SmicGene7540 [Symbiodinium microadriaticum]|uniref:Uncharacterized protein n=1 Tax=Symbiodinium microadriaticum TaxID=2951 RepID=A0A1Q9ENH9_SYMMI|nr:hypothetical protein AK812_SmicGene7540 [Symbiodinium microadriaticum]